MLLSWHCSVTHWTAQEDKTWGMPLFTASIVLLEWFGHKPRQIQGNHVWLMPKYSFFPSHSSIDLADLVVRLSETVHTLRDNSTQYSHIVTPRHKPLQILFRPFHVSIQYKCSALTKDMSQAIAWSYLNANSVFAGISDLEVNRRNASWLPWHCVQLFITAP